MPLAALENLVKIRQLEALPADTAELDGLQDAGRAKLKDAATPGLSVESRFDLAYNAAHALALAALRFHGYRSKNRYMVFQALAHTIQLPARDWRTLDRAHAKRNASEYEGDFDIDEALIAEVIVVARAVEVGLKTLRGQT